jgi:hypothetical protein
MRQQPAWRYERRRHGPDDGCHTPARQHAAAVVGWTAPRLASGAVVDPDAPAAWFTQCRGIPRVVDRPQVSRGCPEFRGTSVAARVRSSGCGHRVIMPDVCGDLGSDMPVKRGAERSKVQMPVDPTELLAGLDHAGRAPAQRHRPVTPPFDVTRVIPTDRDHALDRVGRAQRAGLTGRPSMALS